MIRLLLPEQHFVHKNCIWRLQCENIKDFCLKMMIKVTDFIHRAVVSRSADKEHLDFQRLTGVAVRLVQV